MTSRLGEIVCACLGVLFAASAALAQTAVTPPGALAPEAIQPWGLPPPPPGVGPVELFADIHDTPQGKFLEGGAFDTDGNFWFVAMAMPRVQTLRLAAPIINTSTWKGPSAARSGVLRRPIGAGSGRAAFGCRRNGERRFTPPGDESRRSRRAVRR